MSVSFTIHGQPITKKNSSRIFNNPKTGRPFLMPSEAYKKYEKMAEEQLEPLNLKYPMNLKCVYYMQTKRRVDLCNLLSATCDVLVKHGVIEDDNCQIVVSHDGCLVKYDKDQPRVEITITKTDNYEV